MKRVAITIALLFSVAISQNYLASYNVATEATLRSIPSKYLEKVRNTLTVVYQHTAYGTHVSRGVFGLPNYKDGDDTLFAVTELSPEEGKLLFLDSYVSNRKMQSYNTVARDLSSNDTAFISATARFLDDPVNISVNVVMWAWDDITDMNVEVYLKGIDSLISMYSIGGSEPRSTTNPVTFIFMTGHSVADNNVGEGKPKNQSELIINHSNITSQFCLDYYGIDTHTMGGKYYEDAGDDGQSSTYGGNFYFDFEDSHRVGEDWFDNLDKPDGWEMPGAKNSQNITANRKAYAMWWILARIAGWDGVTDIDNGVNKVAHTNNLTVKSINRNILINSKLLLNGGRVSILDVQGRELINRDIGKGSSKIGLDGKLLSSGLYIVSIKLSSGVYNSYLNLY